MQSSDPPAYVPSHDLDLIGFKATADAVRANIERVIVGQRETITLLLVALFANGHTLIEDVPGMGKTIMARSLARSIGGEFHRIQCTPDLLPGDITGISFYNQKQGEFEFRPGPIFAQVVLADEINRATPRTQSALLEAMAEQQVTVENDTMPLPAPFLLMATQNPIELEGTFALPEAQLDRFLLRLRMGYPSKDEERAILRRFRAAAPLDDLAPVATSDAILRLMGTVQQVYLDPVIEDYLLAIVRATREDPSIELGVSPRGALALARACQALAAVEGRSFVTPDDVKRLAVPVLAHRLITTVETRLHGHAGDLVLAEVVNHVPVPVESLAP
ncbi:MAG TPA: MoxR family ATPase [Ktedonobacterales bacterium]|nr:MoxR family ATPase [Ktedonobacterales bacterium]